MKYSYKIFKKYLDHGTNLGLRFIDNDQSRYVSFKKCLDYVKKIQSPKILELGTSRSYVDGAYEGCNSDDKKYWNKDDHSKWDWGAGCFTVIFGLNAPNAQITTVDLISSHIERCKYMTSSLDIKNVNHIVSDSLNFLKETKDKYDLIYLDTGDVHPIEPSVDLQLQEAVIIHNRELLNPGGFILIDDVKNGTPREHRDLTNTLGKSEKSIPYLKANGFKSIYEGYQYIFTK